MRTHSHQSNTDRHNLQCPFRFHHVTHIKSMFSVCIHARPFLNRTSSVSATSLARLMTHFMMLQASWWRFPHDVNAILAWQSLIEKTFSSGGFKSLWVTWWYYSIPRDIVSTWNRWYIEWCLCEWILVNYWRKTGVTGKHGPTVDIWKSWLSISSLRTLMSIGYRA